MLFNSYSFLLWFLPVSLIGYYTLGNYFRPTQAKIWLIGASFVFYGWWNPAFVLLLLGSIAVNYLLILAILATEEQPSRQRLILTTGIALNLRGYERAVQTPLHITGGIQMSTSNTFSIHNTNKNNEETLIEQRRQLDFFKARGVAFTDIQSRESSLEEIFVGLVRAPA